MAPPVPQRDPRFNNVCAPQALHFGPADVGNALSGMGLAGMAIQGVLVRVVVGFCGEERTLALSMAAPALG